jgi:hypothetical protein
MGGGAAIAAALGGDAGAMAASRAATAGVTEALGGIASGFDATTGFAAATGAACARVTGFAETVTVVTGFGAIGAASRDRGECRRFRPRHLEAAGQLRGHLGDVARASVPVEEDRAVGARGIGKDRRGGHIGSLLGLADQFCGALGAEKMRHVKLAVARSPAELLRQDGGVALGQCAGHDRIGGRIPAQRQDFRLHRRIGDDVAARIAAGNRVGVARIAERSARLFQGTEPGLFDELEQAAGRGGLGRGVGIEDSIRPWRWPGDTGSWCRWLSRPAGSRR